MLLWVDSTCRLYFALKDKDSDSWTYFSGESDHTLATNSVLVNRGSSEANAQTNYWLATPDSDNKIIAILPTIFLAKYVRVHIDDANNNPTQIYEFRPSTRLLADELVSGQLHITDQFASSPLIKVTKSSVDRIKIGNFTGDTYGLVGYDASSNMIFELSDAQTKIGGWALGTTGLGVSKMTLDSSIPAITMGDATDYLTGAGIFQGYSGGAWKFHFGDPNGDYIGYDGAGNLHITGEYSGSTNMDGTSANTFTVNSDLDDVNVQLILGRTTGGNAVIQWDGTSLDFNSKSLTGIDNITVADESWIGIGASDERIVFDTAGNISFMGCDVGVAKTEPTTGAKLHIVQPSYQYIDLVVESALPSIRLVDTETDQVSYGFEVDGNMLYIDVHTYANRYENTYGSRLVTLVNNGNFGFNTTTPRKQIDSLSTSQAQLRLSYSDNSVYADFQVDSNGNLTVSPTGDFVFDPTGNDVYPNTNYDLNLGLINKKFLTLHAAELWVETLVAQETLATIGGRIVVAPTTTLTSDIGTGDTTIYVKHNNLANGDRIYMEANGKVEFMAVTSDAGGSGPYSYTVTRNLDGTGANTWYAGDAILNTGTTGDGFIDIYSLRGIKESSDYGPTIVGNIRNSSTYNDWTEAWAIGNLNGLYGYGTNIYGAAFGKYSAADYITIDPTNGIRFFDSSDVIQAQLKSSEWTIGQVAASKSNIQITSGTIKLRTNTTSHLELSTSGAFWAGDSASTERLEWNSTDGLFITDSSNNKVFQSDPSGDVSIAGTVEIGVEAFANLPSDEDLVGYWAFDDGSGSVAVDGSPGGGNDGTLVNMEEADWVDGVVGKCLDFDGSNEYVNCGQVLPTSNTSPFSFCAWIKAASTDGWNTIIGTQTSYWEITVNAGVIKIGGNAGGTSWVSGGAISTETWYFIVGTYDGTNVRIYVDGELKGGPTALSNSNGDNGVSLIASYNSGGDELFHGLIDEVRIYNRALTASEVKALYLYPAGNKATKISGSQITTGKIQSTNWVDGTSGSMLDLDNELFAIKDDTFGNSGIQIMWDSGAKFYAGDGSNKYFKFDGTNISWKGVNTELTAAGAFTASNATLTGGTIGGWTISSTTLANGTNIILDASNKKISIKNATFGNEGIQLEYNAGTPRFYVGDGSNEYLKYIQGTGLSLSVAHENAITIESGGDIKLESGGDINLTPSDSNPALIKWSTVHNMGAATTAARGLSIWPETADQDWFRIGYDPVNDVIKKYNDIIFYAYDVIHIESQYDATHYAKVITNAGSTDNNAYLQANHGGTIVSLDCDAGSNEVVVSAADFKPLNDATTDIGDLNKRFVNGFFSGYIATSGTPTGSPTANALYKDNIVKAWINFNGTGTIAINDSFNVSSITDNSGGDYTITWDTDFANTDYSVMGTAQDTGSGEANLGVTVSLYYSSPLAVGSARIRTSANGGDGHYNVAVDSAIISLIAMGDQ